jgi:alpha-beta hydrolase superfamily lysophospholipase
MNRRFTERAVLLGKRRSLVGILTRAAGPSGRTDAPAIVIFNTGIMHRVGHHRMYVTMSRALASAGYTVLRFDFSGIGDSPPATDGRSPLDTCLADIREVLDTLERDRQASRFILAGLCSGANHAVLYAHTDPRVAGLVLLDPTIPPTPRFYWHYILERLTNWRNWMSVLTGRSGVIRLFLTQTWHRTRPQQSAAITLQNLQFSPHLERCYREAVENGVQMLVVFTADSTRQTYREQLLEAFPRVPFKDQLRLELFKGSDHLFIREEERSRLTALINDWADSITRPAAVERTGSD